MPRARAESEAVKEEKLIAATKEGQGPTSIRLTLGSYEREMAKQKGRINIETARRVRENQHARGWKRKPDRGALNRCDHRKEQ